MRRKKKITIQVGIVFFIVFAIAIALIAFVVAIGSTKLFLDSKENMMKNELDRLKKDVLLTPHLDWLLDYDEHYPDLVNYERLTYAGISEEAIEVLYTDSQHTYEQIEAFSDTDRMKIAQYLNLYLNSAIRDDMYHRFYDDAFLIDINEEYRGFVFVETRKGDGSNNRIGNYRKIDPKVYTSVNDYLKGDYDDYEFEVVFKSSSDGKSYFIGSVPIIINDKVRCLVCVAYDWSEYQETLVTNLGYMMIFGVGISLIAAALLMLMVYRISIRPLTLVSRSVRDYTKDKDIESVKHKLEKIRTRNEVESLAEDISQMTEEIERYNGEVTKLATEKERVTSELEFASRIQSSMLSKHFPDEDEYDLFASMDPAKEVGGDFYDFFMIDDDHLALVIADVTGKGIPAALFMAMSKMYIRNYAFSCDTPSEAFARANADIASDNEEDMFVTVWFGIMNIKTGHVIASNAGHEYPVIRRDSGDFEVLKDKHCLALGAMPVIKATDYEFDMKPGDTLFVYTDGAPEANDAENKMFGMERLVDALNEDPDRNPKEIIEGVKKSISGFVGEAAQFDDLTMLCLKFKGKK